MKRVVKRKAALFMISLPRPSVENGRTVCNFSHLQMEKRQELETTYTHTRYLRLLVKGARLKTISYSSLRGPLGSTRESLVAKCAGDATRCFLEASPL